MGKKFFSLSLFVFLLALHLVGSDPLPPFLDPSNGGNDGDVNRPKLVNHNLTVLEERVLNANYRYAMTTLEFDQPLYVNEALLCGDAEKECAPYTCEPCDWSTPQPVATCNVSSSCCSPQFINKEDWCYNPNFPPWTTVPLGGTSDLIVMEPNEYHYFRFFVPTADACSPIQVSVLPEYGTTIIIVSNNNPYPYTETTGSLFLDATEFHYAQALITLCPVASFGYDHLPGTFAVTVFAKTKTAFYLEVALGKPNPIPEPPVKILDCPAEEIAIAGQDTNGVVFCLEDSVTFDVNFDDYPNFDDKAQLILPHPAGCHTTTISSYGNSESADADLDCLPTLPYQPTTEDSSAVARWKVGDDALVITACSDEPYYIHCGLQVWRGGRIFKLIYSTTSTPKRIPLTEMRAGNLAMNTGLGAMAGTIQGSPTKACQNWQTQCYEFTTLPLSDPLALWPPPGDTWIVSGPFDFPLPPDDYQDRGISYKLNNTVRFIEYIMKANNQLIDDEELLTFGTVSVLALTNANGDPVLLPNDGPTNGAAERSFNAYVPNIAYSSLNFESSLAPLCSSDLYEKHVDLIQNVTDRLLPGETFESVIPRQYTLDVYNGGFARMACLDLIEEFLFDQELATVLSGQTTCPFDDDEPGWVNDPCCNLRLVPVACCDPYTIVTNTSQFTDTNVPSVQANCSVPECAESFLSDLGSALNTLDDPFTGCSSTILDPENERNSDYEAELDSTLRYCILQSGYGDVNIGGFNGAECVTHEDCAPFNGYCNFEKKRCAVSFNTMEINFLSCFINEMSSFTEDFIRRNILPPEASDYPKNSNEFFIALYVAASADDCVNVDDALDLSQRTRSTWASSCRNMWVWERTYLWNSQEKMDEVCPNQECLGNVICRYNTFRCDYSDCQVFTTHVSSKDTCDDSSLCTVDGVQCDGQEVCAYCPPGEPSCIPIDGVTTEDECNSIVWCAKPNGQFELASSEEECRQSYQECTTGCVGAGCQSNFGRDIAICYVANIATSDCWAIGGWWYDSVNACFLEHISDSDTCLLWRTFGYDTSWQSCDMPVEDCTRDKLNPAQEYLNCFVDIYRNCDTKEECEASGDCTDMEFLRLSKPFGADYGICFNSGRFRDFQRGLLPTCSVSNIQTPIGCAVNYYSESNCIDFYIDSNDNWVWQNWQIPGNSEEECLAPTFGRVGCNLPGTTSYQYVWNETECACRGGVSQSPWRWTDGQWIGGQPQKLNWTTADPRPSKYEYRKALSFPIFEQWLFESVEENFVLAVKSQVLCETNIVTSSLSILMCDCVNDPTGTPCYNSSGDGALLVGITSACSGENSTVKGPSNFITFDETAITELCVAVSLDLIYQNAYSVSRGSASVSFQFETPKKQGVVVNKKEATVGQLVGDGAQMKLSNSSKVTHFRACLRLLDFELYEKYPIRDFGYTLGETGFILPLGVSENLTSEIINLFEFWCVTIDFQNISFAEEDGVVRLFPIWRLENYEDEDDEIYSHSTRALVYTLGACYCFDLLMLLFFLVILYRDLRASGKPVPIVAWLGVVLAILCIFRITFCFIWPSGGFEDNSLAEYVIFEIPTFLLFTVVIMCIGFWRKLSRKSTFLFHETDRTLWILTGVAIAFVWCLFIVVTIVYSEVILEDSNDDSACPGRVESSSDQLDEDTRTLSIVYQSIVIFFTFFLAIIFWFSSYRLFKVTSKGLGSAKMFVFRLGALIVSAFMLRCIFFIILLAVDFTSAVYLFIVLMLTEVIMIFFVQLEFNKRFFVGLVTGAAGVLPSGMNLSTKAHESSVLSQGGTSSTETL